jgi:mono/diheme cytochrome c family protein
MRRPGQVAVRVMMGLALAVTAGAAVVAAWPGTDRAREVSREQLRASFAQDIRNMRISWTEDDPRSEPSRQERLFAFMYQGYESSAWVPQALFDGNLLTKAVVGETSAIIRDRIGLTLWPENPVAPAYGMAPNPAAGKPLSWTVNCLACHVAEIDGVVYFGAGSKVLDEKMLADTVKLVTGQAGRRMLASGGDAARAAEHAHNVMVRHHHEQLDPLTRARSTAFPASHVEMYMRSHEGAMPPAAEVGRGDVKTPPLWHTAAKRPFGRWYCDGSFRGEFPLMASSMELELDQSFDKLANSVLPLIKHDFQEVLDFIRPPAYPHPIDRALAQEGRRLFESSTIGCATCHGTYDGRGNVRWTGLHADVGTDPARAEVVNDGFIAAFNSSPIAAEGRLIRSEGYAATPLTGAWANYPYLHNGSVPTLHHLLGPAGERPRVFSVTAARRFDRERVGQRLLPDDEPEPGGEAAIGRRHANDRDWFSADRPGCGNQGHDFWSRIKTDANRRALIEYLKTL